MFYLNSQFVPHSKHCHSRLKKLRAKADVCFEIHKIYYIFV
jgi:hypothetical protein